MKLKKPSPTKSTVSKKKRVRNRTKNVVYAYVKPVNKTWLMGQVRRKKYAGVSAFVNKAITDARTRSA